MWILEGAITPVYPLAKPHRNSKCPREFAREDDMVWRTRDGEKRQRLYDDA